MAETLKEQLESALATNNNWMLGAPGIKGLNYVECLAKWKVTKLIILRKMVKDLEILEADPEWGNSKTTLVKAIIMREVACARWQSPCGTFPLWAGILSRAKGVVNKQTTGKSDLDNLAGGLFNGKRQGTGAAISNPSARFDGRGSGSRGHDPQQGGR